MGLETTAIWGVNKIVAPFLLETPIDRYVYIYICMIIYICVFVLGSGSQGLKNSSKVIKV